MRVSTAVASAALVGLVAASSSHNAIRRPSIPRRLDTNAVSDPVAERGLLDALFGIHTGIGTWYGVAVSMGACGSWTSADERAVAMNTAMYGNENAVSPWCGKTIKIKGNGKTSFAKVVDACPTCAYGGIDMSKILFQDFADLGTGEVHVTWSWVGADGGNNDNGSSGGDSPSSNHNNNDDKPKHTSTHKPKPTHTSTTTKTTKTSTSTSTKTKTKTKKTKTHKATTTPTTDSNLANLGNVISGFQNLAHAGQA